MSTLYNALKKAEERNEKEQRNVNNGPVPQYNKTNKNSVILVLFLLFVFVAVLYIQIVRAKNEKARIAAAKKKKTIALQPVVSPVKIRQPGEYVLEGVIYSSDPTAVINGKVLKAGEKIDNFVVQEITAQSVQLLKTDDNSSVTLKMQ